MKKNIWLILTVISYNAKTQTQKMIEGKYYLQDQMEVASTLSLNKNNTFDFFYSNGSIDRTGSGTWMINGDAIILNSPNKHLNNFKLIDAKETKDDSVIIKISDPNKMILSYVAYRIKTLNDFLQGMANEEGIIKIEKNIIDTIFLAAFMLYPDKAPSVFEITDKKYNYFEFTIEKWISDVDFDNLKLVLKDNILTGGHPLYPDAEFIYARE